MEPSVLERIAAGDGTAVKECLDRFGGLVWTLAKRSSIGAAEAEDAVQEIFTEIWKSAGRYDARQGSESVFVATIARRRLIDRMRKQQRRPRSESLDDVPQSVFSAPGNTGEVELDIDRASRAVAQLKPDQQRVLAMGLVQGMTHSEIADATGMPLGTVKTQMRRGLIKVRELMEKVTLNPPGGDG